MCGDARSACIITINILLLTESSHGLQASTTRWGLWTYEEKKPKCRKRAGHEWNMLLGHKGSEAYPRKGRFRSSGGWGSSSSPWSPACAFCRAAGRFWQRGQRFRRNPWRGAPGPWAPWRWGWCSGSCSLCWTGSGPASRWWALRRRRPPNLETAAGRQAQPWTLAHAGVRAWRRESLGLNYLKSTLKEELNQRGVKKTAFYSVANVLQRQKALRIKIEEPRSTHACPPACPPAPLNCFITDMHLRTLWQTAEEDGTDARQLKVGILVFLVSSFLHHLPPSFIVFSLKSEVLVLRVLAAFHRTNPQLTLNTRLSGWSAAVCQGATWYCRLGCFRPHCLLKMTNSHRLRFCQYGF